MKILLVNPPFQRLRRIKNSYFPLGLGYLASVLNEEGYYVRIYNADIGEEDVEFDSMRSSRGLISGQDIYIKSLKDENNYVWREVKDTLKAFEPDVVGITAMSPTYPSAKTTAKLCKDYNKNCIVIVGGIHPTIAYEGVIDDENVDYVVRGEGERTIIELINAIEHERKDIVDIDGLAFRKEAEKYFTKTRRFINDLNRLPYPARGLALRPNLYNPDLMGALIVSRGCPFECSFCNAQSLWTRKVRYRSVDNIVAEVKLLKREYKSKLITFIDDTLTANKKRAIKLCNSLIREKLDVKFTCYSRADALNHEFVNTLRKAGCVSINMGVESGSERMLNMMLKNITLEQIERSAKLLKRNWIEFNTTFLIGTPDEKEEDIRKSIAFIKKIKPDFTNVCTYTPYPGSKMYERAVEMNLIPKQFDWAKYSHHSGHNRFVKEIDNVTFEKLRAELINVANLYNKRITLRKITRIVINNWRVIYEDPEKLFLKLLHKLVKGRSFMLKAS